MKVVMPTACIGPNSQLNTENVMKNNAATIRKIERTV